MKWKRADLAECRELIEVIMKRLDKLEGKKKSDLKSKETEK